MFYTYDKDLFYTGQRQGQNNPKTNQPMRPANSTLIAPPSVTSDERAQFNKASNTWDKVDSLSKIQSDADNLLLLEEKNELGVLLYELVDGVSVLRSVAIVNYESNAVSIQNQITAARDKMDLDVLTKAMEITSTTGAASAQASVTAFQWRAQSAGYYVDADLVVRYASGSYAKGDLLNAETDIVTYYSAILTELDLFREAAIATYITQKTALEAI